MRISRNLLSFIGLLGIGAAPSSHSVFGQRYYVPAGKRYVSRSRYTPGGPNRNCGDRGISPKRLIAR